MQFFFLMIIGFIASQFFIVSHADALLDKPDIFIQLGHQNSLYAASFSQDGKYLVTGSEDRSVKLWDVASGMEVRTFTGHEEEVKAVAVSPDGSLVVSGDRNGIIKLWDVVTGREIRDIIVNDRGISSLTSLTFSFDSRFITSVGLESKMKIWEVATGQPVRSEERLQSYPSSGETVVITSSDFSKYLLIELPTGKVLGNLPTTQYFSYKSFSRDGHYGLFVNCDYRSKRCHLETFDIRSQNKVVAWDVDGGGFFKFNLSPDGRHALMSGTGGLRLWDAQQGKELKNLTTSLTTLIVFSPDGKYILSSGNYSPTLWDVDSGKIVRSFVMRPLSRFDTATPAADGRKAVISQSVTNHPVPPALLDLKTGVLNKEFKGYTGAGLFSADGNHLILVGDKKIMLWNTATNQIVRTLTGDFASFSPDGSYVIESTSKTKVTVSETSTGKELVVHTEPTGSILNARLSTDNQILVVPLEDRIKLLNAATGNELRTLMVRNSSSISFADTSPDGRYLVAIYWVKDSKAFNKSLSIWELPSGREVATYPDAIPAAYFQISPDSKSVLFANGKGLVLCDLASGRIVRTFAEGEVRPWSRMKFSLDSKILISGDGLGTITFRDVVTGRKTATFKGHRNGVTSVYLSPDGRQLVSSADDGTTRFWDVATTREIAQFARFTDGEWIVITPEGYYNASPKGDKYLNVRVGKNVYGIENYRETFFRPDLVTLVLSGGSLDGYRTLADVKQPPKVSIVQTDATSTSEEFKLTLRLDEQGGGIGDLRLFLNGSAVILDSSRSLKAVQKDGSGAVYRSYILKLSPGGNTIRAIAFNADNSMQSNDAVHQVTANFTATRKPTLHALVIGIQEFRNPRLQLKYAVADAKLFADTLRKGAVGLFDRIEVTLLTSKGDTTRESLIKALQGYKKISPDDLFILYIASHGTVDDGEYFLITSNVSAVSSHRLKTDALSQVQLKKLVANIPSTKRLIVLDTCNAAALGDAIQVAMLTRGMSEETAIKVLSRAVGSTILSASTSVQEALEGYQGHGLFTWALVQGLMGKADKGKTGFVRTNDLATYVEDEVPMLSERIFKRVQQPSASMNGQSFPVGKAR
jgi:WD40 repeat protein